MTNFSNRLGERFRMSVDRIRERREHDRAMTDPRIRDEHFAARSRDTAAGQTDCHFCVA